MQGIPTLMSSQAKSRRKMRSRSVFNASLFGRYLVCCKGMTKCPMIIRTKKCGNSRAVGCQQPKTWMVEGVMRRSLGTLWLVRNMLAGRDDLYAVWGHETREQCRFMGKLLGNAWMRYACRSPNTSNDTYALDGVRRQGGVFKIKATLRSM